MYEPSVALMRLLYTGNVLVAGTVGALSLFAPKQAVRYVFGGTTSPSVEMRVVGSLWLAIAALSLAGLVRPHELSPVFLLQLIYKGLWLLVVALPAVVTGRTRSLPIGMAVFFLVWVVLMPFAIPYGYLFR